MRKHSARDRLWSIIHYCGTCSRISPARTKTLALLDLLPQVPVAQLSEVRLTIEARRLYSSGIGLTDAHLIASVFSIRPRFYGQKISDFARSLKVLAFTQVWLKTGRREDRPGTGGRQPFDALPTQGCPSFAHFAKGVWQTDGTVKAGNTKCGRRTMLPLSPMSS